MFTGIIEHLGNLDKVTSLSKGLQFCISHQMSALISIGDSVAINGVCLTVTDIKQQQLRFDVSPETLEKTNLGMLGIDAQLHLELPLSLSKPLGGHFVTGHVDQTLRIAKIIHEEEFVKYTFEGVQYPEWICQKGSVTLEGVSLTINAIPTDHSIECMLIPHTITNTRFKDLKETDLVNVEYDYIAKIVARQHALEERK